MLLSDVMKNRIVSFIVPVLIMLALVGFLAYMAIKPDYNIQGEYTQYGVVFPVDFSQRRAFESIISAGGIPLRVGKFDFIQIIVSKDESFIKKAYDNDAVFVFTPVIKGACYFENQSRFGVRY